MTPPLRRYLLNREIASEARRIAHAATKTCTLRYPTAPDFDDEHTKNCNCLKREIEALALNVKLAGLQSRIRPVEDAPTPFVFEVESE